MARNQATAPPLSAYRLVARTASCVVKGQFVDDRGFRVGDCFSETVLTGGFSTFSGIGGGQVPAGAVGAIIDVAGDDLVVTTITQAGGEPNLASTKANGIRHADGSRVSMGVVPA